MLSLPLFCVCGCRLTDLQALRAPIRAACRSRSAPDRTGYRAGTTTRLACAVKCSTGVVVVATVTTSTATRRVSRLAKVSVAHFAAVRLLTVVRKLLKERAFGF